MKNKIIGLALFQLLVLTSCKEEDLGASPQKISTVAGKTGDVVITTTDVSGLLDGTGKVQSSLLPTGISSVTMSGDVTSASNTSIISRLKGILVTITSLTTNDVLQYDGTNWVNAQISYQQYAGEIITFAGTTCPTGTLLADGAVYARTLEPNLFAAIGCAHGCTTGTTFSVPDLRGRFIRYMDSGTGRDPDAGSRTLAAAGGNTGNNIGTLQGHAFASHTHTQQPHGHNVLGANSTPAGIADPTSRGLAGYQTTTGYILNSPALGTPYIEQTTAVNDSTGGNETRPINVYMLPCIRRYNR